MKLVGVKEIAFMLSVKPSTVYQWAELGQIPCIRLNGALRFDSDDIIKWVAACKKEVISGYNPIARTMQRPRKGGKE